MSQPINKFSLHISRIQLFLTDINSVAITEHCLLCQNHVEFSLTICNDYMNIWTGRNDKNDVEKSNSHTI